MIFIISTRSSNEISSSLMQTPSRLALALHLGVCLLESKVKFDRNQLMSSLEICPPYRGVQFERVHCNTVNLLLLSLFHLFPYFSFNPIFGEVRVQLL